jgi:hypothetical protein
MQGGMQQPTMQQGMQQPGERERQTRMAAQGRRLNAATVGAASGHAAGWNAAGMQYGQGSAVSSSRQYWSLFHQQPLNAAVPQTQPFKRGAAGCSRRWHAALVLSVPMGNAALRNMPLQQSKWAGSRVCRYIPQQQWLQGTHRLAGRTRTTSASMQPGSIKLRSYNNMEPRTYALQPGALSLIKSKSASNGSKIVCPGNINIFLPLDPKICVYLVFIDPRACTQSLDACYR